MTTSDQERMLDKVMKLLTHAHGTMNQSEAESFAAKAQQLMTQWNLDAAMVQARMGKQGKPPEYVMVRVDIGSGDNMSVSNRRDLMSYLCRFNFARMSWPSSWGYRKSAPFVNLVGERDNLEVIEYLYNFLVGTLAKLCADAWYEMPRDQRPHRTTYSKSYYAGALARLYERLRDQFNRSQDEFDRAQEAKQRAATTSKPTFHWDDDTAAARDEFNEAVESLAVDDHAEDDIPSARALIISKETEIKAAQERLVGGKIRTGSPSTTYTGIRSTTAYNRGSADAASIPLDRPLKGGASTGQIGSGK